MVAPNPIDMSQVFAGLKNLGDNLGVLMVILTLWILYALLVVWAKRKDRKDKIDVSHLMFFTPLLIFILNPSSQIELF